MMDTDTSLKKRQHHGDLWEFLVFLTQGLNGSLVDLLHRLPFVLCVEVAVLQGHRISLTVSLGEGEDDAWVKVLLTDESDQGPHLLLLGLLLLLTLLFLVFLLLCNAQVFLYHLDSLGEIVLLELALLIYDKEDARSSCREEVVLQWSRSEVCIHHITSLIFYFDYPFAKFSRVWNCG